MDDNELAELAKLKEELGNMMSVMLKNITTMLEERANALEIRFARFEEDMARMNQERRSLGLSVESGITTKQIRPRYVEIGGELLMRSPFE